MQGKRICIRSDKRVDKSLWNHTGNVTSEPPRRRWVNSTEDEWCVELDVPPEHDPLLTHIWLEPSMWDAASEAKVEIDNSTQQANGKIKPCQNKECISWRTTDIDEPTNCARHRVAQMLTCNDYRA